jgi:hypothetical protein
MRIRIRKPVRYRYCLKKINLTGNKDIPEQIDIPAWKRIKSQKVKTFFMAFPWFQCCESEWILKFFSGSEFESEKTGSEKEKKLSDPQHWNIPVPVPVQYVICRYSTVAKRKICNFFLIWK